MTDIFPATGAVYPPASLNTFEYPYSTIGFQDTGAQRFNDCRVIVHKNRLIVGTDSPRGPQAFFSAEVQEVLKDPISQLTRVTTTNGYLVVFSKSKSCGCGSRLRSWNPYGTIVSA